MSHDFKDAFPVFFKSGWTYSYRWTARAGVLYFSRSKDNNPRSLDLRNFRLDFLRVKPTAREFARLLNRYRVHLFSEVYDLLIPLPDSGTVDVSLLAEAQRVLNEFLRDPREFDSGYGDLVVKVSDMQWVFQSSLEWRDGLPALSIDLLDVFDGLLWTVIMDRLRSAKFKVCQRPDCRARFRVESRHRRKYCSPECAHLMAVRASRRPKEKKLKNGGK